MTMTMHALIASLCGLLISATALAADPVHEVADRINAQRRQHKLPTLRYNDKLAVAAQSQADWMARAGKMTHLRGQEATSFEDWKRGDHHPVNRMIHAGYFDWHELYSLEVENGRQVLVAKFGATEKVDEIIAHGSPQSGPGRFQPTVIVGGWMNSSGHRKTILTERYQEVGVGFTRTAKGDAYWCAVFGKK